jgi:hypothetical protein
VILDWYQEDLVALGSESYSSRPEPASDSWVQLYQWTHNGYIIRCQAKE